MKSYNIVGNHPKFKIEITKSKKFSYPHNVAVLPALTLTKAGARYIIGALSVKNITTTNTDRPKKKNNIEKEEKSDEGYSHLIVLMKNNNNLTIYHLEDSKREELLDFIESV